MRRAAVLLVLSLLSLVGCSAPVMESSAPAAAATTAQDLDGTYVASASSGALDPTAIVAIEFLQESRYSLWRNTGCPTEVSDFTVCDPSESGTFTHAGAKLNLRDDATAKTVSMDFATDADPTMVHPKDDNLVTPGASPTANTSIRLNGTGYQLLQRRQLPSFQQLLKNYPAMATDEAAQAYIGGAVNASWITNACTIRLSRALNYSNFLIPQGPAMSTNGLHTVKGGDGENYAFRVAEMRNYLVANVGQPLITKTAGPGGGVDPSAFAGKQGIIAFTVPFSDATGHFDLWDGSKPAHAEYFSRATKVELWETPP